jgi:hypothetical protein
MKFFKKWLVVKLCLLMVFQPVFAQTLPARTVLIFDTAGNITGSYVSDRVAASSKLNNILLGTYFTKFASTGITPSDVRVIKTTNAISTTLKVVGGSAAAIAVGTTTAPAWLSIALGLGISFAISYAVDLAVGAAKWAFRSDNNIDVSTKPTLEIIPSPPNAGQMWKTTIGGISTAVTAWSSDGVSLWLQKSYIGSTPQYYVPPVSCAVVAGYTVKCDGAGTIFTATVPTAPSVVQNCPNGYWEVSSSTTGTCKPFTFPAPSSLPITKTPSQAIADIPYADAYKNLNPTIIAAIADRAWQQAASKPNYDGLPYSASNPITAADVTSFVSSNPTLQPTVSDFVRLEPASPSDPSPWALPTYYPTGTTPVDTGTGTGTGTGGTGTGTTTVDLGPDPAVTPPNLETPPTPHEILDPILNLLPTFKNFTPSIPAGACPKPSFTLFGNTITLQAHCTIIDEIKPILKGAMSFAWVAIAAFIILSA